MEFDIMVYTTCDSYLQDYAVPHVFHAWKTYSYFFTIYNERYFSRTQKEAWICNGFSPAIVHLLEGKGELISRISIVE